MQHQCLPAWQPPTKWAVMIMTATQAAAAVAANAGGYGGG